MKRLSDIMPDVIAELSRAMSHPRGAIGRVEECEIEHGHKPIRYGAVEPISFSRVYWHDGVITQGADGKTIRIVMIAAKQPRNGALTRMLREISDKGLTPVIVANFPFGSTKAMWSGIRSTGSPASLRASPVSGLPTRR